MGGAARFFLELMLFIGFKYKLNMTMRLGHGNPLHIVHSAQYYKSSARSYPRLNRALKTDKQMIQVSLVSHKSHNNCVQNQKSKISNYLAT